MNNLITASLILISIYTGNIQPELSPIHDILQRDSIQDILFAQKEETIEERVIEYPIADYIWNYLKNLGYNDYICAGILGNIMVETGGNTFDIDVNLENSYYYGIVQWSKTYYPGVIGTSLEEQCNYLRDNIEYEFNTFGKCYRRGFNYASFLLLEDEQEAALAFAKCFERCSKASYGKRKECAKIALEYFSGLKED